jgi:hypothetical protein
MYIDDKANLPWNTNSRFESLYGRKSNPFFVAQKKKDGPTYGKRITKRGQQFYKYPYHILICSKHPISICHFYHKLYLLNPAPAYIPDRVWFCDKDKQVYH